jgi:hypothetical protein
MFAVALAFFSAGISTGWSIAGPMVLRGLGALLHFCLKPSNLVIAGLLAGIAFSGGYWKGRWKEQAIWEAKIANERRSQNIITSAHDAKASRDLQELNDEREILNSQVETLRAEALRDANAARVCLGTDSLHRINRGRKGKP